MNHTVSVRLTKLLRYSNHLDTPTLPPAPKKRFGLLKILITHNRLSKRIILKHEDGIGGSYRYELEENLYVEEATQTRTGNDNQISQVLEDFKVKLLTLSELQSTLESVLTQTHK